MDYSLTILYALGSIIIAFTLIPLVKSDYWVFRVFEFPRAQKLILSLLVLALFIWFTQFETLATTIFSCLLILNSLYLFYQIFPYTLVAPKQMLASSTTTVSNHQGCCLSIMASNVYQYNRRADKCLRVIKKNNPDIILLVETDEWWQQAMRELEQEYPFSVQYPRDNTYGMLLFSRLPLKDAEIKFLVEKDIPSIHAKAVLRSGQKIQLYCIHPKPPAPGESTRTTERNAEILLVGKMAKESPIPCVVFGDLNDVAWSYTTKLFLKTSGLLDPRRGRGFYNSFHAKHFFLRWPLDHFFCSKEFRLIRLKRLEKIESDHFPMLLEVMLEPAKKDLQEPLELNKEEQEEVEEKIEKVDKT